MCTPPSTPQLASAAYQCCHLRVTLCTVYRPSDMSGHALGRSFTPSKLPLRTWGSEPALNIWFLGPTQVHTPNTTVRHKGCNRSFHQHSASGSRAITMRSSNCFVTVDIVRWVQNQGGHIFIIRKNSPSFPGFSRAIIILSQRLLQQKFW